MKATEPQYHWVISAFDIKRADMLAKSCGLSPLLAHLLLLRGVSTPEDAHEFLNPSLKQISSPYELDGMRDAIDRIMLAKERGESILIFGDYDVDGIAAAAILYRGLRRFGLQRVICDMPDRFAEGYGLTPACVERAKEKGHTLLITVDNGISAHEAANRARALGLDLIITDHHSIEGDLPDAVAVINPKRGASDHFAAFICGAGVAFKLSFALNGTPNDLDLVALGTVSDIVPLLRENRVYVALGLQHIKKYQRIGIAKLAEAASFNLEEISAQKIGFHLGPRLNAAGRLDTGHASLELLMLENKPESETQAEALAQKLNAANEERRAIEKDIYDQAVEILDAFITEGQRSIVVAHKDWHQGVIGIVASRLQSKYSRPVIVFSLGDDGYWHGSGRSGPGFNMVEALNKCADLLVRYGGHVAAAGLTLTQEHLEEFRERFEAEALRQMGWGKLRPILNIDATVVFSQIDGAFVRSLDKLEPYGQANPEPLFCAVGVDILPKSIRVLKDQHLKFTARQGDVHKDVIAFRMAERFCKESLPEKADMVFTPQINTYNDGAEVQLVLKDLCHAASQNQ